MDVLLAVEIGPLEAVNLRMIGLEDPDQSRRLSPIYGLEWFKASTRAFTSAGSSP